MFSSGEQISVKTLITVYVGEGTAGGIVPWVTVDVGNGVVKTLTAALATIVDDGAGELNGILS